MPEGTAEIRQKSMVPERTKMYFGVLKGVLTENNLLDKPMFIWNMDETLASLSPGSTKVVARKGTRTVHAKCGNEEGVTILACGNASGKMLPVHFIVKGKTKLALKSWDTEKAPVGSYISVLDSDGQNRDSLLWFEEVFLKNIGEERPQILVFDGHNSHHHIELIEAARANNIILMEMPAHCLHWLQPLDRTVFGPLKKEWRAITTTFRSETGLSVSRANFFRLFKKAWVSVSPEQLKNGFRSTGIYPWNPDQIPPEAYLPSTLYSTTLEEENDKNAEKENLAEINGENENTEEIQTTVTQDTEPNIDDLIQQGATLVDLGIHISDDGTIKNADPMLSSGNNSEDVCPPDLAHAAIECSLTEEKRRLYEDLLMLGTDIQYIENV